MLDVDCPERELVVAVQSPTSDLLQRLVHVDCTEEQLAVVDVQNLSCNLPQNLVSSLGNLDDGWVLDVDCPERELAVAVQFPTIDMFHKLIPLVGRPAKSHHGCAENELVLQLRGWCSHRCNSVYPSPLVPSSRHRVQFFKH